MIKLQLCAAVGIPEQYFGDISTGSLATAQTVELPMLKMFGSYQQVWAEAYKAINEVVLEHNNIPDFPAIAPQDALAAADALSKMVVAFPQLADSDDVLQQALMALGVNDTAKVIEDLKKARDGEDADSIKQATEKMMEAAAKLGEEVYKASQAGAEGGDAAAGAAAGAAGATPGADASTAQGEEAETVDAEYEVVEDNPLIGLTWRSSPYDTNRVGFEFFRTNSIQNSAAGAS